jgi:hypothetical protein
MNVAAEIEKIKHELEVLNDEALIEAVQNLLIFARKHAYESNLKPMSVEDAKKRAFYSEEDIQLGRVSDVEDL